MIKMLFLVCGFVLISVFGEAQKFTVEKGQISFFSDAAVEDIEAVNSSIASLYYPSSGDMAFVLKIKDFVFDKALMQEHFNEKYMESEKFPKSTFQGKVSGFNIEENGEQIVRAAGKLMIHGVTKDIDVEGTLKKEDGKLQLKSAFIVKLEDYKVQIPTLLWQNIAEQVEVRIDILYKPL